MWRPILAALAHGRIIDTRATPPYTLANICAAALRLEFPRSRSLETRLPPAVTAFFATLTAVARWLLCIVVRPLVQGSRNAGRKVNA